MAQRNSGGGDLRTRAERAILGQASLELPGGKLASPEHIIHELRLHQAELEMQNEELRLSQMRLREAHDRYYELYDFAPTGYFVLNEDWRIVEANNTAAALLGIDRAKLLRERLSHYLSETECDSFHFYLQKLKADPDTAPFEGWLRRRDGKLMRGLVKVRPTATGFRVALVDITPQRMAEDELRKKTYQLADTSHRLHQIARAIADVFYAVDVATGKVLYLSDASAVMFLRVQDEGLRSPQRWLNYVRPEDLVRIQDAWLTLKSGAEGFDIEYRIMRPDGEERWIRDRGFMDRMHNQVAGVLHDFTQERDLEDRLRQAQSMGPLEADGPQATIVSRGTR